MKSFYLLAALLILGCSTGDENSPKKMDFLDSLRPSSEIGSLERLTDDGRGLYPIFAPGDSLVYFNRLLVTDAETAAGITEEDLVEPYGIDIADRELYTLSGDYRYPRQAQAQYNRVPKRYTEYVSMVIASPDSSVAAFETTVDTRFDWRAIYLIKGDSIIQLTFGDKPCFLDRFSNTGRYLTAVCGTGPTWIMIYDTYTATGYKIEKSDEPIDYMTSFSPDDKMMLFIRSKKEYSNDYDYFGDVWLFRFDD